MSLLDAERAASEAGKHLVAEWGSARVESNLSATHARIRRKQRERAALLAAAAVSLAAAIFVIAPRFFDTRSALGPGVAAPSSTTRFRDGSSAELLRAGSELEVRHASERGIEVAVNVGAARFDVVHDPARAFSVVAGPVTVHVIGTRFSVEREAERVRVSVERGRVRVTWPAGQDELEAGESAWFPRAPQAAPAESAASVTSAEAPRSLAPSERERFLDHARRREYKEAYALLAHTPSVITGSAEDLMLAADSARLSGHPEQAIGYLQRIVQGHAQDSRAPLAAFTLGKTYMTQLSRFSDAARAFAQVRALSPGGPLSEDSYLREIECLVLAGDRSRANARASEYRTRYPGGRHTPDIDALVTLKPNH